MTRRLGVLISGNGSTLQTLLDQSDWVQVSVVISSRESAYGLLRARRAGVPVAVLPKELRGKESKHKAEKWILDTLKKYHVQDVFLAGFMRIVSEEFIQMISNLSSDGKSKIYNIHPSLLPKYRGIDGFGQALKVGDKFAGATVHEVVPEIDAGPHVLQRKFDIPAENKNENALRLWLHVNEQRVLSDSVKRIMWQSRQM